ncbi:hypothetical protein LX36DRAFT_447813 [Colletotrichum falcatum]|nr:hypothetical protein LX36DRAFT_447813 [Colletotrichum falcatum]
MFVSSAYNHPTHLETIQTITLLHRWLAPLSPFFRTAHDKLGHEGQPLRNRSFRLSTPNPGTPISNNRWHSILSQRPGNTKQVSSLAWLAAASWPRLSWRALEERINSCPNARERDPVGMHFVTLYSTNTIKLSPYCSCTCGPVRFCGRLMLLDILGAKHTRQPVLPNHCLLADVLGWRKRGRGICTPAGSFPAPPPEKRLSLFNFLLFCVLFKE